MDHDEWQAAYRRATMDKGTAQDYIEDLMIERDRLQAQLHELRELVRQLEAERDQWQRQVMNNG